nr:udp-glycosyltransferase 74e2 [Quercus suber]
MERKIHILVIPYPLQGHINPMLQFSKRLASKGPRVTFIATSRISKSIQAHESSSINFETISDGSEEVQDLETSDEKLKRFKSKVSQNLPKFIEKHNSSKYPPKFLVYDSVLPWALNVARQSGLDGAPFFTQSCVVNAIYYHAHQGTLQMPLEEGLGPRCVNLVVNQFSNFQEANWLLCNTFDKLEDEVINWMASQWPFKTIGPAIPSMYLDKRLEDDKEYGLNLFKPDMDICMKWLDTKEIGSVVYISFGSMATLGEEQMEEITWGLKNSNCYFLWVVRESEEKKLPNNFLLETAEKGLIVGIRVKVDEKGIGTKEEIELCIREVIEGERGKEMKRNSMKWKELAKEAVDEDGSSDKNIEEFVTKLSHS